MKVTQRTNLKFLVVLLIFCQFDFNAARTNALRGSKSNSVNNKINKGKRTWSSNTLSTTDESTQIQTEPKTDELIREVSSGEKKTGNEDSAPSRIWLELESVPPTRISAKRLADITLECTAVGSPPPMIYWLKNGKPLDRSLSYDADYNANGVDAIGHSAFEKIANFAMAKLKSKLPIRCIGPEDEAEYTCVADNNGRQLLASTIVSLEADGVAVEKRAECELKSPIFIYSKKARRGQPAFVISAESLHMEVIGSDIILPCRGGGRPRPFVSWINSDGQRVTIGKKYQINSNGDLVIRNLSWNEMGEFTCTVENNYGSDSASTFLYPLLNEES